MVGDMENLKVRVKNEVESKEVQEYLEFLGIRTGIKTLTEYIYANFDDREAYNHVMYPEKYKKLTIQQLRDVVVLKRNSIEDATHFCGGSKYYLTDSEFYQYSEGKWVNIDEYVDGMTFNRIEKEGEMKMKEYLDTNYELRKVKQTSGDNHVPSGWFEVPEGADIAIKSLGRPYFLKLNGETYNEFFCSEWRSGSLTKHSLRKHKKILWERNTEVPNTSIQEKLKFIEKWLNGEKIQYILGIESEKTQWHNFTEGAMQYIKRSDIKFREAPKYVTINGIEFKSVKSLLKHVKSNFDLEDEK